MSTKNRPLDPVNQLVLDAGAEANLARRVAAELASRSDLSQEKLARLMADAGCPVPQSAISRIVKPPRGGARAVSVTEAIAFAKVLGISLAELLLPEGALENAEALRELAYGPELRAEAEAYRSRYEYFVRNLAETVRRSGDLSQHVDQVLATAQADLDIWDAKPRSSERAGQRRRLSGQVAFLRDVVANRDAR